ncbi:hypothetical protein D3C80_1719420 [compost metagenome]
MTQASEQAYRRQVADSIHHAPDRLAARSREGFGVRLAMPRQAIGAEQEEYRPDQAEERQPGAGHAQDKHCDTEGDHHGQHVEDQRPEQHVDAGGGLRNAAGQRACEVAANVALGMMLQVSE